MGVPQLPRILTWLAGIQQQRSSFALHLLTLRAVADQKKFVFYHHFFLIIGNGFQRFVGQTSITSVYFKIQLCVYLCLYIRVYVCMYVCVYLCLCVFMFVCICLYVCVYVCMYLCICMVAWMYI